jgi:hypothetical protein
VTWVNTDFLFGPNNAQIVTGADPALVLSGTETSGQYTVIQEVSGSIWFVQNAYFNGTNWVQEVTTLPSYAMQRNTSGATIFWFAAAVGGTTPLPTITWTQQGMPNFGFPFAMRNKLINGNMEIDQRNAQANITPLNNTYGIDRWKFFLTQAGKIQAGVISPGPQLGVPAAFAYRFTSTSAYTVLAADQFQCDQVIEAQNIQEFAWGNANAQPVTLSFMVRNTVAGTYSVAIQNFNATRSYVTTYTTTPAQAGFFQYVTLTIPGDQAGTWNLNGTSVGLFLEFDLGTGTNLSTANLNVWQAGNFSAATGATKLVASNAATMDLSVVQLETGSTATPFEQRLYGVELDLCHRYCYAPTVGSTLNLFFASGYAQNATQALFGHFFPTTMRAAPSAAFPSGVTAASFLIALGGASVSTTAFALQRSSTDTAEVVWGATGMTAGFGALLSGGGVAAQIIWSAEL